MNTIATIKVYYTEGYNENELVYEGQEQHVRDLAKRADVVKIDFLIGDDFLKNKPKLNKNTCKAIQRRVNEFDKLFHQYYALENPSNEEEREQKLNMIFELGYSDFEKYLDSLQTKFDKAFCWVIDKVVSNPEYLDFLYKVDYTESFILNEEIQELL